MMLMRKRHRLIRRCVLLRHIRRSINLRRDPSRPRNDDQRTEDSRLGDGIGGGMEDLCHPWDGSISRANEMGKGDGEKDYKRTARQNRTPLPPNTRVRPTARKR